MFKNELYFEMFDVSSHPYMFEMNICKYFAISHCWKCSVFKFQCATWGCDVSEVGREGPGNFY